MKLQNQTGKNVMPKIDEFELQFIPEPTVSEPDGKLVQTFNIHPCQTLQ